MSFTVCAASPQVPSPRKPVSRDRAGRACGFGPAPDGASGPGPGGRPSSGAGGKASPTRLLTVSLPLAPHPIRLPGAARGASLCSLGLRGEGSRSARCSESAAAPPAPRAAESTPARRPVPRRTAPLSLRAHCRPHLQSLRKLLLVLQSPAWTMQFPQEVPWPPASFLPPPCLSTLRNLARGLSATS